MAHVPRRRVARHHHVRGRVRRGVTLAGGLPHGCAGDDLADRSRVAIPIDDRVTDSAAPHGHHAHRHISGGHRPRTCGRRRNTDLHHVGASGAPAVAKGVADSGVRSRIVGRRPGDEGDLRPTGRIPVVHRERDRRPGVRLPHPCASHTHVVAAGTLVSFRTDRLPIHSTENRFAATEKVVSPEPCRGEHLSRAVAHEHPIAVPQGDDEE